MNYLKGMEAPVTRNNEVKLLMSGREKFTDLFESIHHARHHIHLEYFNFRNDSIANVLFELLAQKAGEGVEVRAMFDAFGNWSNNRPLKKRHLRSIRARGIEIVKFDPITFPWINHAAHRDHRKIAVIDGQIGYTGGMNIADYYINGLPKIGNWHDMHLHLEGDAVRYLQGIFLTMWNRETGQHVGGPAYFPDTPQFPDSIAEEIAVVDRTPRETPRSISHAYAASIQAAQKSIRIVNPYFVPTKSIRQAIKNALKKGVEVEIMIPAVSDIYFTPEASFHIAHKLMKKGAKIYLFNGGFHHSKIMMVDGSFCTVGTANLNSRSLRYDYETNAFIFDPATTCQLDKMFERDKLNSTLMTPEYWKKRPTWKKFVGWVGNLLTPFL
ncbi:cardiolipin synthase [Bacteroides heparinolyticus]|uniref:cardiolipin synthase n=1 Tax=Prevotella heparinolytica TaxID=28113 RepID=UPI000D02F7BD|nr:cardiolipin synthase [Bacteroides heparinolyticus]AVM57314.1 cardiolipin synthase [Bacteroides heparinolyticus]